MNPQAQVTVQDIFRQALQDGPDDAPRALQSGLAAIPPDSSPPAAADIDSLEHALVEELPFLNTYVFGGKDLQPGEKELWVRSVRWVLNSLRGWSPQGAQGLKRLQLLLTALGILDHRHAGADVVAASLTNLLLGLRGLLDAASISFLGGRRSEERWAQQLGTATQEGNLEWLEQLVRHAMPRVHMDMWTATYLLWKLAPEELAQGICGKNDPMFSLAVCEVLDDKSPQFALGVANVAFKFLSVQYVVRERLQKAGLEQSEALAKLLTQVAQTPSWKSWLRAHYKYLHGNSVREDALAAVLPQLQESQWVDFIQTLSLANVRGAAKPVADLLARFEQDAGPQKARAMWSLAFERWNAWDYDKAEKDAFFASPVACALDYPIAMYYAHLPAAERDAVEAKLTAAIENIEQEWFSSQSDLVTQRNRLSSRLRLVRHGRSLAGGGTAALPPPIEPDDEYSAVRYRFYDVLSVPYG